MTEPAVTLAAVAGAHGIAGELRLKLFAEGLDSVKRHKRIDVGGRSFSVTSVRTGSGGPIVRLAGIDDRNAAEALRGQLVTVPRSALPPLAEGEYYHVDLLGLPCTGPAGEGLGSVIAIENFGAGDIVEIERTDGSKVMVPFRKDVAELRDGAIVVDPAFLT